MSSFGLALLRVLFATAEHVAPRAAGEAAFRLFCRTNDPGRLSARERAAIFAAAPAMAEAERHFLASRDERTVLAYRFPPTGRRENERRALVIHGWRSRSDHMVGVISALRGSGFTVIAIDLPGHGQSTGRRLSMADAAGAVSAAERQFGRFEVIAGHSFGGLVAVNAVSGTIVGVERVHAERLVLVSSPSSVPDIMSGFGDMVGLGPRTRQALGGAIRRVSGRPLEKFVGAHQLAATGIPALVIHAPDDKEVPFREARAYASAGDKVQLVSADGLGHRRIVSDKGVLTQIASYALGERRLALVG